MGPHQVLLCRDHHEALGEDAASPFADLASLQAHPGLSRRRGDDRRRQERRLFPRPEGRRLGAGRRATDPQG